MFQSSTTLFLICLALVGVGAAQTVRHAVAAQKSAAEPDVDTIVARMQQAQEDNRARSRAYTVTREYKLFSHDTQHAASDVVAQVSFMPPDSRSFDIRQSSGSSRGEKIVRNILEAEKDEAAKHDHAALTRENYQFRYLGTETVSGCSSYVLELVPKRREKDLIEGRAWVDTRSYLVHRIQGDLSKSPSWWLKAVHIKVEFGEVGGMWLQTATQALAEVRFFGEHSLESHALHFQTAEAVASKKPTSQLGPLRGLPIRPLRPAPEGVAVFIHQ